MKQKFIMVVCSFITAVGLVGCNSSKKIEIPVKDYSQVPLYMAGQEIPDDSQEKYLYNASVKMYSVGRLVDSGSGTMREAGTVYRIESTPQWNLIPQYDANPESFAKSQKLEQYSDALVGQMNRSMLETREVKHGLYEVQKEMADADSKFQALTEENSQLKNELEKHQENTNNLLESMKKMQKYIELLEQKVNDRNTMNIGGRK